MGSLLVFFLLDSRLRRLFSVYHRPGIVPLVTTIVIVATMTAVIIVAEDQDVAGNGRIPGLFHGGDPGELLVDCPLHELVLLVLVQLAAVIKVNLVKSIRLYQRIRLLHMQTDWQDP